MSKFDISKPADITLDLKKDAKEARRRLGQHIQFLADKKQIDPGLYDPNLRNSQGKPVPVYRQVLAKAGIDLRGNRSAQTVGEAFFRDPSNTILFPYYIEERYREIQNEPRNLLSYQDLVAERIPLTGGQTIMQIPVLKEDPGDTDGDPSRVSEGSEFPLMTIEMGKYMVQIAKYGGRMEATLETIMGAQLSVFDRWLTVFARKAARQKVRTALKLAKNGDGNDNAAPNVNAPGGEVTTGALVLLLQKAAEVGAEPSVLTGDGETFGKVFDLDILTRPDSTAAVAESFRNTGKLPGVLGLVPKLAPLPSVLDGSNQLLAIDPERGLIEVYSPEMDLVEYEYLMKRQVRAVQVTEMLGFGKPDIGVATTLTLQQ